MSDVRNMAASILGRASVSVVIPTFNGQATIAQTLRSLALQNEVSPELVVVDDGSSDATIDSIARSGVPVKLVHQKNGGVCRARNAGAAVARGDYLCFVDQDDLWHPDHLRTHLAAFALMPDAGVVVGPYQHWESDESPPVGWSDPVHRAVLLPRFCGWVFHEFMLDCWALTSATTLRREVWDTGGGFDERQAFGEEWDLWLRVSRQVQFAAVQGPSVLYRQHPTQGSRQVRTVDYRTELLLRHFVNHGLVSRDGRRLDPALFNKTIARYVMEFGRHHIAFGESVIGRRAMLAAWRRQPLRWRYLALWALSTAFPNLVQRRLRRGR